MKFTKADVRSVRGQLALLAITFLGAIILAVAALCLRSVFFEAYVREKHAPLPAHLKKYLDDTAAGKAVASAEKLGQTEIGLLYGAWFDDAASDPEDRLARCLISADGRYILGQLRRTLVAGNLTQRTRAVRLLTLITVEELKSEVIELCRYVHERAWRRGELELVKQAQVHLNQLQPPMPESPQTK